MTSAALQAAAPRSCLDRATAIDRRFARRYHKSVAADCGFSSQALYRTEVHDTIVWEKFKALRRGADLATERLWGRSTRVE